MAYYGWITGILTEIIEYSKEHGLTETERALENALPSIRAEVGPGPYTRGRQRTTGHK